MEARFGNVDANVAINTRIGKTGDGTATRAEGVVGTERPTRIRTTEDVATAPQIAQHVVGAFIGIGAAQWTQSVDEIDNGRRTNDPFRRSAVHRPAQPGRASGDTIVLRDVPTRCLERG